MKKKNVLLSDEHGELELGIISFKSEAACHVELWSEGFHSGDIAGENYCECLREIQRLLSAQSKKLLCYGCRTDFRLHEDSESDCAELGYLIEKSQSPSDKYYVFDYTNAAGKIWSIN